MNRQVRVSTGIRPLESRWHDALRLFLLTEVVLGHLAAIALPTVPELRTALPEDWFFLCYRLAFRFGGQAAFLFVFLSGFMVAGPMLARLLQGSPLGAREFFTKRFTRLAPVAVVAVLLTLVIDRASQQVAGTALYRGSYAGDMLATAGVGDLLGNLAFLEPIVVPAYGSNGPLWTLGYIAHYYVLGWVVCRIAWSQRVLAALVLTILLVAMAVVSPEWAILFVAWFAGGAARLRRSGEGHAVLLVVVAGVLFVASNLAPPLVAAAMTIPVGFALTMGMARATRLPGWLDRPRLRWVSNESFTIYAIHHPVLMAIFVVVFDGDVGANPVFLAYALAALTAAVAVSFFAAFLITVLSRPRREQWSVG